MPRHSAQFIQDFLFTNSDNHVEFLKWIEGLDKDDYMLLVYLLERLSPVNHPKHKRIVPFHPSFDPYRLKNPLNVAKAYVALIRLSKHEFNVFEVAYLDPNPSSFYVAVAALICQWLLLLVLFLYHVVKEHSVPDPYDDIDNFILVTIICAVSTYIFFNKSVKQWANCGEFIEIFSEMGKAAPLIFFINRIANQLLSFLVLFFNVYFVMISPDPSEAILDALTLFFIIEVDDELVPDWDDEYTDDVKANGLSGYLQHPLKPEALYVTIRAQGEDDEDKMEEESPQDLYHHGPGLFVDQDKLYADVSKEEQRVSFWIGVVDPQSHLTTNHIRIDYEVHGDPETVEEFLDVISNFKCIRGLKDIIEMCDPANVHRDHDEKSKSKSLTGALVKTKGSVGIVVDDDDETNNWEWNQSHLRRHMIPGGSHYNQVARPFKKKDYHAISQELNDKKKEQSEQKLGKKELKKELKEKKKESKKELMEKKKEKKKQLMEKKKEKKKQLKEKKKEHKKELKEKKKEHKKELKEKKRGKKKEPKENTNAPEESEKEKERNVVGYGDDDDSDKDDSDSDYDC